MNLHLGLVRGLFSVHDDILAFPQFQVSTMDSYYTEEEAAQILSSSPPSNPSSSPSSESTSNPDSTAPLTTYETLFWNTHKYLCSIPLVQPPPPMNATEKEQHKLQEEKELARATTRGWELLNEMDGKCLYFISGWWSYSFCYGNEIKQYHQSPTGSGTTGLPPKEDPMTASYVLGRVEGGGSGTGGLGGVGANGQGPARKGAAGEGTELQGSGELRYLVQKMGGGTICDITGKERRIEVQYHCNPSSTDRIGFVKEVSICCYLMVVYTPRLCNDMAFLPPSEGGANMIKCKEILGEEGVAEWKVKRKKEERLKQLVGEFEKVVEQGEGERRQKVKGISGGSGKKEKEKKKETREKDGEKVTVREKEKREKVGEKKIKFKGENNEEIILLLPEELEFLMEHEEL
ncbi:glucosidase II beta subunit-like protein-domain-containing protein [Tirmania nivea]|nr:glucosidase II beta subunit-like protein-domain-containing protein [Tirmania nivea]